MSTTTSTFTQAKKTNNPSTTPATVSDVSENLENNSLLDLLQQYDPPVKENCSDDDRINLLKSFFLCGGTLDQWKEWGKPDAQQEWAESEIWDSFSQNETNHSSQEQSAENWKRLKEQLDAIRERQQRQQEENTRRLEEQKARYLEKELGRFNSLSRLKTAIERLKSNDSPASTGLPNLDKLLNGGIKPNLYVLGACSSVGKTTLCLQIADFIASLGRIVLFFSLEQTDDELNFKTCARMLAQQQATLTKGCVPSAAEFLDVKNLTPDKLALLHKAIELKECAHGGNLYIFPGPTDVDAIRDYVVEFINKCHETPIVFVDYLQKLVPTDPNKQEKANIDTNINVLTSIVKSLKMPVIVISSFNRDSYNKPASWDSFKESGNIEFSADVLLALELEDVEKCTGKESSKINDAKIIQEARKDYPRRVRIVLLKSRMGQVGAVCKLKYYPDCDLFREDEERP